MPNPSPSPMDSGILLLTCLKITIQSSGYRKMLLRAK